MGSHLNKITIRPIVIYASHHGVFWPSNNSLDLFEVPITQALLMEYSYLSFDWPTCFLGMLCLCWEWRASRLGWFSLVNKRRSWGIVSNVTNLYNNSLLKHQRTEWWPDEASMTMSKGNRCLIYCLELYTVQLMRHSLKGFKCTYSH